MKKQKLTLILLILTIGFGWAQKIEVNSGLGVYEYRQDGKRLPWKKVKEQVSARKDAFELLQKARNLNTWSWVTVAGSGAISIVQYAKKSYNLPLSTVSLGSLITSFIISHKAVKSARKGIETYNSTLNPTVTKHKFKPQLNFNFNANGACLALRF